VLGTLALFACIELLRIKADLDAGQQALRNLDLDTASAEGGIPAITGRARAYLDHADHSARTSLPLRLLDHVPFLGGQIDGLRELTGTAGELGRLADDSARKIDAALQSATGDPSARVHLLDVTLEQVAVIATRIHDLHPAAGRTLMPPLSNARDALTERLDEANTELADATRSITAVRRFLVGPSRYLVLAANNAEMTAGSGMPESGGVAEISNGDINLGDFIPTSEAIAKPVGVPIPEPLRVMYQHFGFGYDFRGTTATPNFPVAGPLMQQMAAITSFGRIDGVIVVDAFVLRDLLELTGPVEVNGVSYTDQNVMEEVLNTNYLRFDDPTDRAQRTDLQSQIAKAAFDAFKTRPVKLTALVKRLEDDAKGRHLLAWSADPDLEKVWGDIGASGRLLPNGLMVSTENAGGNKLDWYLRPRLDLTITRRDDGFAVSGKVTVRNDRHDPSSKQLLGAAPDRHYVFLDLHLPGDAFAVTAPEGLPFLAAGPDPPMQAVNFVDPVPIGEEKSWDFSFLVPTSEPQLVLMPSARVSPLIVTVNGRPTDDAIERTIDLAASAPVVDGPLKLSNLLLGGLALAAVGFLFALFALVDRRRSTRRAAFDAATATWLLVGASVVIVIDVVIHTR
jgi:hypothetical protein